MFSIDLNYSVPELELIFKALDLYRLVLDNTTGAEGSKHNRIKAVQIRIFDDIQKIKAGKLRNSKLQTIEFTDAFWIKFPYTLDEEEKRVLFACLHAINDPRRDEKYKQLEGQDQF